MSWEIAFGIAMVTLVLIGAYVKHLQSLVKESKELYLAVKDAIADRDITREELRTIFKETQDVGEVILSIAQLFARK